MKKKKKKKTVCTKVLWWERVWFSQGTKKPSYLEHDVRSDVERGAIVQDKAEETALIKGLGLYSEVKVIQSFKLMRVFKSSKFHFRKQHSG